MNLYVNGNLAQTFSLNATGGWNQWAEETHSITVTAGFNTFVLAADAGSVGPNVDEMTLQICTGNEICGNGIDDDGDNLIDSADPDCATPCTVTGQSIAANNGTDNAGSGLGIPDGNAAALYDATDQLVIDLGQTIPSGTTYTVTWKRKNYGTAGTADMIVEESADNNTWTTNGTAPSTDSQTSFVDADLVAAGDTRYIRISPATGSGDDFDFDAIVSSLNGNCLEICNNNIDDDGDGNVDCEDDDCPCSATCPDEDGDGLLTVCRRNSANELGTTQTVTVEAWATTQGPFDYCGTCADYITVNNGDWNSSSTWRNGNVPPLSISGKMVRIVHNVDVTSGNITLDGGTQMTVDGSILDLVGDQFDLNVKSATVNISNGATVIVGDDLKMNNNNANIQVSGNSTLEARKRMAHTWGSVSLHNSTLLAGAGLGASRSFPEDYDKAIHIRNNAEIIGVNSSVILHHTLLMDGGTFDLTGSCVRARLHWDNRTGTADIKDSKIEIAGNFINENGSHTTFNNSYLYLSDDSPFDHGNILSTGPVTGQLNALYVPSGDANVQNWNVTTSKACVTGSSNIPGSNDCQIDYVAEFGQVSCFDVEPISGQRVNLLKVHTGEFKGTNTPILNDEVTIPAGNNRQMIVVGFFERNHCGNCPSGTNYSGLGDNFANGSDANGEASHTLNFRVAGTGATQTKANQTSDSFGNHHSARNMYFNPQSSWEDELEDYHKAIYSNEIYFTVFNESEINSILGGASSGDITVTLPNYNGASHNADDAILQVYIFENIDQSATGVALTGKIDEGHDFFPVDHIYNIPNLQDGFEPNEPTDGILAIGFSPIKNDFTTMPNYATIGRNDGSYKNTAAGSTNHGEADEITINGMFRHGPATGTIDSVTMQQEGINPSSVDPLGGVVLVFTLESID